MSLGSEIKSEVAAIFRARWTERDGNVVPEDESIKLTNDGVNVEATVLYADMADSTHLVAGQTKTFAAEIYKTFLHAAAKIIRNEGGTVTAYDGDRIFCRKSKYQVKLLHTRGTFFDVLSSKLKWGQR